MSEISSECKIPMLFEIMKQRGIKANALSAATGISTGNISDWKSGRSKPSIEKSVILANYFGVSTDYLWGNEQKNKSSANTEDYDEDDIKFMKRLKTLSTENREQLDKLMDFYLSGQGKKE